MSVPLRHKVEGRTHGPTLVFGNSLGTDLSMWDAVVEEIRDRCRVVRFDHRGQGSSPVPDGPYEIADLGKDVLTLLDDLGIERATYCGVSLGGMVGLWLAATAPLRIERLIACCTSAHPGSPAAWAERAAVVTASQSTSPIAEAVVARWVTRAYAARHPEVVSELRNMLVDSPPRGYAACCGVLERLDLRSRLTHVCAPTLVISSEQDEAIPPTHGREIAAGIASARFVLLDPGAHLPMIERSAEVAALVLDHLELSR
jgi:3-oxoadipate enol-lactonase